MATYKTDVAVCNNLFARNFALQALCLPTSATTLELNRGSQSNIIFTGGTAGQIVDLPDATDCLHIGHEFRIFNESTEIITIRDFDNDVIGEILPGASCTFVLKDNLTSAGTWVHQKTQLSKVMIDLEKIVGISGTNSQEFVEHWLEQAGLPIKNETPGGAINCVNTVFTTEYEFISGTLEVIIDGNVLTNGLDFVESADHKGFTLLLSTDDCNRLSTPPKDSEDLRVNYCRKVIFC